MLRTAARGDRRSPSSVERLVGLAGFEPAASCTQSTRASQAALQPVVPESLAGAAPASRYPRATDGMRPRDPVAGGAESRGHPLGVQPPAVLVDRARGAAGPRTDPAGIFATFALPPWLLGNRLTARRSLLRRSHCEMLARTIGFILWRAGANARPRRSGSEGGPGATLCRG